MTIYIEQWVLDAFANTKHPPIGGSLRAYVHAAPAPGRVAFVPADVALAVQAEPVAWGKVAPTLNNGAPWLCNFWSGPVRPIDSREPDAWVPLHAGPHWEDAWGASVKLGATGDAHHDGA